MDTTSSSSSDDDISSSDCELDEEESSCDDDLSEKHEISKICGATLQLPQLLCESKDIFKEFFSLKTFNSLSEINKQHLKNFLPSFPDNDEQEKNTTLQKLFNRETFRFNSPLTQFHDKLKAGHFRPDISRMRKLLKQEQRKEYKFQQKIYAKKMLRDLMVSRQHLLDVSGHLPPGLDPKFPKNETNDTSPRAYRTKRRYFQELAQIKNQVEDDVDFSDDENYPEGPPCRLSKKLRRHLNGLQNSGCFQNIPNSEKTVVSTLSTKPQGMDLENSVTAQYNPYQLNEDSYRALLLNHKKRRFSPSPEHQTKGMKLKDVAGRTQLTPKKQHVSVVPVVAAKRPKTPRKIVKIASEESEEEEVPPPPAPPPPPPPPVIVKEKEEHEITTKIIPACLSDLEGIDMMSLPVDLEDSNIDILEDIDEPNLIQNNLITKDVVLMQETHSNFLSLIRDVICSTIEHRMSLQDIEDKLKGWQSNPISPLNTWYSLTDNWLGLLPSAITFLTGEMPENPEDYVPYLEFKPNLHLYQWIGAGRDSDTRLNILCHFWLEHRDDVTTPPKKAIQVEEVQIKAVTPPPPKHPTNWVVRKAEFQEVEEFREQERLRYQNPHKSFTYRMNGYESIVGPVKGMYNQTSGLSKARGHSMLNADRPNFVTILTLVRDAVARLPNGEGTRSDICELLKSSQYISQCAPENVLQSVVSGALDRLHTEFDPSVKYDTKKKIWIYLHRNRSESDFERIHQQFQGLSKQFKKSSRKAKPKTTPVEAATTTSTTATTTTTATTPITKSVLKEPPEIIIPTTTTTTVTPKLQESDQDIEKVIQTITPITPEKPKSLVKIINPTLPLPGNLSLPTTRITEIPNPNSVFIKQMDPKPPKQLKQPIIVKSDSQLSQQQILQTIKQKVQQQSVLSLQQALQKQKINVQNVQQVQQKGGTSLLGQRIITPSLNSLQKQPPLVAKVLTNAQGQVISVESLLAHQKQHGTLPQGTTLRVSGTKQPNLIQLGQQFVRTNTTATTIVSKQKFVPTTAATSTNLTATNSRIKVAAPKIVPIKTVPKFQIQQSPTTNLSNVRMVNTTGLNLAQFAGKPILLASKSHNLQNLQNLHNLQNLGQNVILQPNTATVRPQLNQLNLKVQGLNNQQIVLAKNNVPSSTPQTVVLGGALKMAANNRVVLASQGSSGQIVTQQILLPGNFQGGAINIKTLQGLKVIPLAQTAQQTKGRPQVFARIMNPQTTRISPQTSTQPTEPSGSNNNIE